MASPKTEQARRQSWHDDLSRILRNQAHPRETRDRDRTLRGKARRLARKAARRGGTDA